MQQFALRRRDIDRRQPGGGAVGQRAVQRAFAADEQPGQITVYGDPDFLGHALGFTPKLLIRHTMGARTHF